MHSGVNAHLPTCRWRFEGRHAADDTTGLPPLAWPFNVLWPALHTHAYSGSADGERLVVVIGSEGGGGSANYFCPFENSQ